MDIFLLMDMKRELTDREQMKAVAFLIGQFKNGVLHTGQSPLSPKTLLWHVLQCYIYGVTHAWHNWKV